MNFILLKNVFHIHILINMIVAILSCILQWGIPNQIRNSLTHIYNRSYEL